MFRTITAGVILAIASLGLTPSASAMPAHAAAGVENADQFIKVHGSGGRLGYGGHRRGRGHGNYRRAPRYDYYPPWPRFQYRPHRHRSHGGYRGQRGYRGYDQPRRRHNTGHFRKNEYRSDTSFIIFGPGKIVLR